MAQTQRYPTYNPQRAALVDAMLAKGRRGDQLRRLPTYDPERTVAPSASTPTVPPPVSEPERKYPVYNPERTPQGDERLTGEGGAELGTQQVYPRYTAPQAQATVDASGQPTDEPRPYPVYKPGPAAQRLDDLVNTPATDRNGRLRSGARLALEGPTTSTDSVGNAAGQVIANFVGGLLHKSADEELDRRREIARARPAAEREAAEEKRRLEAEDTRSQINLRDSTAEYNRGARVDEASARREDRNKQRLVGMLRTMPTVDPAKHTRFLDSWERTFGEPFDVDAWNNKKGNFTIRGIFTDPSKPQEKHDIAFNFADGTTRDLGLSAYTVPRDTLGMSENERRVDSDRDRAYSAMERQRSVSNELRRFGLSISAGHLDLANLSRDDRLSEQSRKEIASAAKLRSDAEAAQMDAEAFKGDGMYKGDDGQLHQAKWAAQRWKTAEDKAESLRRQYFQSYGYLHAPDGKDIRMTTGEFRQLFPNAPNPTASAPSYGVILTDSDQPGTPQTNTYAPRRSAPRSPLSAAPHSQAAPGEDPHVRDYADQYFGGDYGAAQRAIEEQRRRKGQ